MGRLTTQGGGWELRRRSEHLCGCPLEDDFCLRASFSVVRLRHNRLAVGDDTVSGPCTQHCSGQALKAQQVIPGRHRDDSHSIAWGCSGLEGSF